MSELGVSEKITLLTKSLFSAWRRSSSSWKPENFPASEAKLVRIAGLKKESRRRGKERKMPEVPFSMPF